MENGPIISINRTSPYPGADPEVYERFLKWGIEVYGPLLLKSQNISVKTFTES